MPLGAILGSGQEESTGAPDPKGRARAIKLFVAAVVLIVGPLFIPKLVGWYPDSEVAREHGIGRRKRGDVLLELEAVRDGKPRPFNSGDVLAPDEKLRLRYEPAGYVYVRVVEVRAGAELVPLVPDRDESHAPPPGKPALRTYWGRRTAPNGEAIDLTLSADGATDPIVLHAIFSPIPVTLDALHASARATGMGDPRDVAGALLRLQGKGFVILVRRSGGPIGKN